MSVVNSFLEEHLFLFPSVISSSEVVYAVSGLFFFFGSSKNTLAGHLVSHFIYVLDGCLRNACYYSFTVNLSFTYSREKMVILYSFIVSRLDVD